MNKKNQSENSNASPHSGNLEKRGDDQQRGRTPNQDDQSTSNTNDMDVDPIPVTILEVPKQFKASIPVTVVSGINSEKLGKISRVFYHYDSFEHASFINKRNKSTKTSERRIQICFTNKEDFEEAINKEYNWSDEEGAAP